MHLNPDSIALLALGEDTGYADERAHVHTCSVCTAQVEELARVVELGRSSEELDQLQSPSPVVWERIRAELFDAPEGTAPTAVWPEPTSAGEATASGLAAAGPEAVGPTNLSGPGRRRTRGLFALVAAIALIAGLGLGFGIARLGVAPEATAAIHLNGLPSWPGAEGRARVDENEQGQQVLVVEVTTPQPVDGQFEVWLSDDKALHMTDMGTMTTGSGTFVIPDDIKLADSPVVDVSLEPVNDSNPEHSKISVVRGRLRI